MGSPERTLPLPPRASRRTAAIAAAVYLGLALWAMRAILPAPASFERSKIRRIIQGDQKLTAATVTHHARTLVTRPWTFLDSGQCYPAPHSVTLGEHMLGNGLLGVVPYALTGDPILTYNTVVTLTLWIPTLAMYALVYFWTGSVSAAFVAGLLFGMHPGRIGDPVHPYVHGKRRLCGGLMGIPQSSARYAK